MTRQPVSAADMIAAGQAARDALSQIPADAWSQTPSHMTWTRHVTESHTCSALQHYATQIAAGSKQHTPTVRLDESAIDSADLPELVRSQSLLLASVAKGVPSDTRARYITTVTDVEAFLAFGCGEVLLHCWDSVQETGVSFEADEDICDRILQRIFPWAPADTPRWQTLLWVSNRGDLEGRERVGDDWIWHTGLREDWDGKVPRSNRWNGR